MYASIRRYKVASGKLAELEKKVQSDFIPKIHSLEGFSDYYWIRLGADSFMTVSVFDNRQQAEGSVAFAQRWIEELNMGSYFVGAPDYSGGEIAFEDHAGAVQQPTGRPSFAPSPPVH